MKKTTEYMCSECGYKSVKHLGKCPNCNSWNTLNIIETIEEKGINKSINSNKSKNFSQKLNTITPTIFNRIKSNIPELDRVLGGGIVRDGITILTAEPGTGKSTLLMQVSDQLSKQGETILYVSGEENEGQLKSRGDRLGVKDENNKINLLMETNIEKIIDEVETVNPSVLIIDSIQKMYTNKFPDHQAGNKTQVKNCGNILSNLGKTKKMAIFIIVQQTKNNELAGPRELEHEVDTVLFLEGYENNSLRVMRASKNRFGNTEEIGLFEMEEQGLRSVDNPSEILITKRDFPVSGVALTVSLEGNRPLVVEIESLFRPSYYGNPMIVSEQIKRDKLNTLLAILGIRGGINVGNKDLFVQVTGGINIKEPAINLGVLMSMVSSYKNIPLKDTEVFVGEVSLTGDIKKVGGIERRIKELDRLGFKTVYIPSKSLKNKFENLSIKIIEVCNLKQLLNLYFK